MNIYKLFRFEPVLADSYTLARLGRSCILLIYYLTPNYQPKPKHGSCYGAVEALSHLELDRFAMSAGEARLFHSDLKQAKRQLRAYQNTDSKLAHRIMGRILRAYDFDNELESVDISP